jgi:hypothetical protein
MNEFEAMEIQMSSHAKRAPKGIIERYNALMDGYIKAQKTGNVNEWKAAFKDTAPELQARSIKQQLSAIDTQLLILETRMVLHQLNR